MKQITFALLISVSFMSCNSTPKQETLNANPAIVLKKFRTWWDYNSININLTRNYMPVDTSSKEISREDFLKALASGYYVAFKVNTPDSSLKYQLHKLDKSTTEEIASTARQVGQEAYAMYLQEGKEIPDFNYKDLTGKMYNSENTKGKIVIIKCWFVNCTVCIQEMPALNKFVSAYKDRDDVLFISLAYDSEEKLKAFLKKTKFDYAVIHPEPEYLSQKLGVSSYPTQFIVNRKGKIAKVVSEYQDMIASVKDELAKK